MIAVDDESDALWALEEAIVEAVPEGSITCFQSARLALEFARETAVDVAFLDIEMPGIIGIDLARQLKEIRKDTNIIFVTGHSRHMGSAFKLHASGYLLKPVVPEDIKVELENLRRPVGRADHPVRIQCFGNFEIFVDGTPVSFSRSKSREALAYLVDRKGAGVSNKELAAVLWEDAPYNRTRQSHLYTILAEMKKSLRAVGAEQIVIKQYNSHAIDVSQVACDYFDFFQENADKPGLYHGEYMSNYSWAERTMLLLDQYLPK